MRGVREAYEDMLFDQQKMSDMQGFDAALEEALFISLRARYVACFTP